MSAWLYDWQASEAPDQQGKQLLPTEICEKHELGWTGDEQMIKWPKRAFKITQPNTTGHQYLSLVCTYHKIINQQRINTSQPTEECMTTAISQVKLNWELGFKLLKSYSCCVANWSTTRHSITLAHHSDTEDSEFIEYSIWTRPSESYRTALKLVVLSTCKPKHQSLENSRNTVSISSKIEKKPYTYLQTQEHMEQKDPWKGTEAQHRL